MESVEQVLTMDALKSLHLTNFSNNDECIYPLFKYLKHVGSLPEEVNPEEIILPESSLGGLGFVSPVKVNLFKEYGYFLRCCTKVKVDLIGVNDVDICFPGVSSFSQGFGGHPLVVEPVCSLDHQSGALREVYALSRVLP